MADGITSTDDLLPYVFDRLFDSFSDESLSDVDDRNNNDVGELSDRAGGNRILITGVFSMATRMSVMMKVTVQTPRMSCALYYQWWMMHIVLFL